MISDHKLGVNIRAALINAGWSQNELAEAIGINKDSMSRSIAGTRPFRALEVAEIARLLKVPVADLLYYGEISDPKGVT